MSMKLDDEQNLKFMTDSRRIAAQRELDEARHNISVNVKFNGSAIYYLKTLPPMLKRLQNAYDNLQITETLVEDEIISGKLI